MPAHTRHSDGTKDTGTSERSSAWTAGGDFAHLQVLFSLSIPTASPQHPHGEAVAGCFAQTPSSLLPPVPSASSGCFPAPLEALSEGKPLRLPPERDGGDRNKQSPVIKT